MKINVLTILPAGLIMAIVFSLTSCRKDNSQDIRVESRELYTRSLTLLKHYTDSIKQARDSATVLRLDKALDNDITKVNAEYSPEAALKISEGENDTLTMMTMKFINLRDTLLRKLSKTHPTDSIPTDTIPTDTAATQTP